MLLALKFDSRKETKRNLDKKKIKVKDPKYRKCRILIEKEKNWKNMCCMLHLKSKYFFIQTGKTLQW